jgi:hypothetical protein
MLRYVRILIRPPHLGAIRQLRILNNLYIWMRITLGSTHFYCRAGGSVWKTYGRRKSLAQSSNMLSRKLSSARNGWNHYVGKQQIQSFGARIDGRVSFFMHLWYTHSWIRVSESTIGVSVTNLLQPSSNRTSGGYKSAYMARRCCTNM